MSNCKTKEILLLLAKAIEQNTINTYQEQGRVAADKVFKILEEAEKKIETLDVEEALRCKDCKHLTVHNSPTLYAYCEKTHFRFEPFQADTRTHYCSYGERKDENG